MSHICYKKKSDLIGRIWYDTYKINEIDIQKQI